MEHILDENLGISRESVSKQLDYMLSPEWINCPCSVMPVNVDTPGEIAEGGAIPKDIRGKAPPKVKEESAPSDIPDVRTGECFMQELFR